MGILTRYLIRAHLGPFLFSFSALTGLLFLNAIAQRMDDLVGKGLTWGVVGEFLVLSLPHTLALTLPMSILVAVLYTFSELTSASEITAMAAGGIRPARLVLPIAGVGVLFAGLMFYFNDQVLPHSNHELKNLIIDIGRKSPTFDLRERVVNEIRTGGGTGKIYLQAREIDNTTSTLTEVKIYDLSNPLAHRTTYAERGEMAFNATHTDLYLTLYNGVIYEVSEDRAGGFTKSAFETQITPMRGVGNELERRAGGSFRGDREMTGAMLRTAISEKTAEMDRLRDASLTAARGALVSALGSPPEGATSASEAVRLARATRAAHVIQRPIRDDMIRRAAQEARQTVNQMEAHERFIREHRVEIHKKYSIAVACLVFVLLGAPIAVRSPRGGVGNVIAVSVGVFALYWAGLIGGENLADEGLVPPVVAMWSVDVLLTAVALVFLRRMAQDVASSRGGGLDDLGFHVTQFIQRLRNGSGAKETGTTPA